MISRAKKISIITSVAVSVVFLAFFGYATWLKFFPAKQGYGTFVTTLESQDGSVVGDVYAEKARRRHDESGLQCSRTATEAGQAIKCWNRKVPHKRRK